MRRTFVGGSRQFQGPIGKAPSHGSVWHDFGIIGAIESPHVFAQGYGGLRTVSHLTGTSARTPLDFPASANLSVLADARAPHQRRVGDDDGAATGVYTRPPATILTVVSLSVRMQPVYVLSML